MWNQREFRLYRIKLLRYAGTFFPILILFMQVGIDGLAGLAEWWVWPIVFLAACPLWIAHCQQRAILKEDEDYERSHPLPDLWRRREEGFNESIR